MTYFINTTMWDTLYQPFRKDKPSIGETWYVKLPNSRHVDVLVVNDLTAHTVEFTGCGGYRERFVTEDVQFVERVYQL